MSSICLQELNGFRLMVGRNFFSFHSLYLLGIHFFTTSLLFLVAVSELVTAAPAPWDGDWWGISHRGSSGQQPQQKSINVQLGPRPYYLIDNMKDSPLKKKLESCSEGPFKTSSRAISHGGAPLMFPEHSRQGYMAAARMGAGTIECDVSFASDRELVCRHSNCDLHYTTNILAHPDLAAKCTQPFNPYDPKIGTPASAKFWTSDITLVEFKSLCAEMEATTFNALNTSQSTSWMGRMGETPDWRTNMYAYECAEVVSLKDQIKLVESYNLNFTAEAKTPPQVPMPFQGNYTQQDFAQKNLRHVQ
ncbi:Hypothetical protein R9X50_00218900 [Acrodontium crateriforme]|uniref:glycerophosphodiester phosphodiesterase n=1 Tax=Acrodontium crateriforme TaxID=150365 RepID=A0AAQ3R3A9_9PEZI|nr:Hypothetical protein R9X50_00218900 [Acrodontium crateriforme]